MKKLKLFLFLFVATLGSWSCTKTKTPILVATFESDSVNGLPAKDLVGAPSGDSIVYHDAIQPRLSVKEDSILFAGSKFLHFARIPLDTLPPEGSQWLRFKGIGTDLTQTLWFIISGKNNGSGVTIEVSDGDGHPMAEIRIGGDGFITDGNLPIGNVHYDPHIIVFTMFTSRMEYRVTITTASDSGGTTDDMITTNPLIFSNPAHPTVSFRHNQVNVFGGAYEIGSVTITREEP